MYVHIQWKMLEQVFGKGQKRMDLLAECASNFFVMVQWAVLLDIQLTISKLGDPAQSGKFGNMTLAKLAEEVEQSDPKPVTELVDNFHKRIAACLQDFSQKSAKVRERRNKYLAHSDYDTALDRRPVPILTPTRREIEASLESLRALMRELELHFGEPSTAYSDSATIHDGEDLIMWLKWAHRYDELMTDETIDWNDWRMSPFAGA